MRKAINLQMNFRKKDISNIHAVYCIFVYKCCSDVSCTLKYYLLESEEKYDNDCPSNNRQRYGRSTALMFQLEDQ